MHKPESKCLLKCPMLPLPWSPPCPTRPDLQRAEIVAFNVSLFPVACVQRDSLRNSPWALSNPPLPVQCYFQQCHSLYLPSEPVIAFKIRLERWMAGYSPECSWLTVVTAGVWGFPGGASGKEPAYQCRRHKRHRSVPGLGMNILWRRQLTAIFLLGESHGQMNVAGYCP